MSVFYFSKEADNSLSCHGAIYLHQYKNFTSLYNYDGLNTWSKYDHIFLELDISKIIDPNEVLLVNFNLGVGAKKGTTFRIYEVDPFNPSSLTEYDLTKELAKEIDPLFELLTVNNDYEVELFENDITKYVKNSITNDDQKIYIRIEHDSIYNVSMANPLDYQSLLAVETDKQENCMTSHDLGNNNKLIVNDAKGSFIQVLPSIDVLSFTVHNSQYTDKSNIMTNYKYRVKEDNEYRYTIYDNFGIKAIYRYMTGDFAADYYELETVRGKPYVFLNVSDLSFFEDFNTTFDIIHQDGTVIKLSEDGTNQDFEGNKIYNIHKITKKDGSYYNYDWSNQNQVILTNHNAETITLSISDNKIDSIEIPKWNKRIELEYVSLNNRYYITEYKEYNCGDFTNDLVNSNLFEYDTNKYLNKFKQTDNMLETNYTYEDSKLKTIIFDSGLINSFEYTYHPSQNYTEVKNQFNEITYVYYNDASQKVMIMKNDDYISYESQSNYNGEYIRQFKEVVSIKDNVLLNTEYQTNFNDPLLTVNNWNGFNNVSGSGDIIENNTFFPEVIGSKVVKFIGDDDNIREFKTIYHSNENYEGDEWFFSIWFKADIPLKEVFQVEFIVNKSSGGYDRYTFDLNKLDKNWQILTGSFIAKENYTSIVYSIKYQGSSYVHIGKPKLYRKFENTHYDYNKLSQLDGLSIGSTQLEFIYDGDKLKRVTTPSGRMMNYIYDTHGKILEINDDCSLFKIENEYSGQNLLRQTRTTMDGKTSTLIYLYNEKNELIKTIDEQGVVVDYVYDMFGRLVDVQDSSGIVYNTKYDQKGRRIETKNHLNDYVDGGYFQYNSFEEISSLTTKNKTEYKFTYDDKRLINNITVNGSGLDSRLYEYEINNHNTGMMTEKKYGTGDNNKFQFEYDDKFRLLTKKNNQTDMVTMSYDDENNKFSILDHNNQISKMINFDTIGRTIKEIITDSNQSISEHQYFYNDHDGLQKLTYISNDQNDVDRTYEFDYDYEIQEYSLDSYLDRVSFSYLNDYLRPNNAGNTVHSKIKIKTFEGPYIFRDAAKLKLYNIDFVAEINQNVMRFSDSGGCLVFDKNILNSNRVDGKYYGNHQFNKYAWDNAFKNDKIIYAWIKLTGNVNSNKELMRLGDLSLHINPEKEIFLNDNGSTIFTELPVFLNEWTLIGLRVNRDYPNNIATVFIDGRSISHNVSQVASSIDYLSIGSYPVNNATQSYLDSKAFSQAECIMDVLYVGYGTNNISHDNLTKIYKDGKYYLDIEQKQNINQISYYNHSIYAGSEVITLNGSYVSSLGKKPKSYSYTDNTYKFNKNKLFKYDHKLQRYTYGSFSSFNNYDSVKDSMISYDLSVPSRGSINVFVKPSSDYKSAKRTILEFVNGSSNRLSVYMDNDCYLNYSINGTKYNTYLKLNLDEWNMITLLLQPNQVQAGVNMNMEPLRITVSIDLTGTTLFVGSGADVNIAQEHFEGQLQMLSIWNNNISTQQISEIYNDGLQLSIQTEFDHNGRLKAKNIVSNGDILTTKYQYFDEKHIENSVEKQKINALPTSEIDIYGNEIVYVYDEYLNVTTKESIDDSGKPFAVARYEYDDFKRLTKETTSSVSIDETDPMNVKRNEIINDSYEYKYDSNGNILEKTYVSCDVQENFKDTYYYSTKYKDRLERVSRIKNGVESDVYILAYSYEDQFRPTTVIEEGESKSLIWKGPRLMQCGSTQYAYNENGLRVHKVGTNLDLKYELDGFKVIKFTNLMSSETIHYHFDQNEEVIGFLYDGKEFLFEKNILGEIYGIIDKNGIRFVEYKYTAYGVPTIEFPSNLSPMETSLAEKISGLNIYLYKGYIYDQDTRLYYCQTRYYQPEIGRWLSIDDVSYLDPVSIGGLNLYAYCRNNPVMYSDITGYAPEWLKWTIGGIVIAGCFAAVILSGGSVLAWGALAGSVAGGFTGLVNGISLDEDGFHFDSDKASTGFMLGSIVGAISGSIGAHVEVTSKLGVFAQHSIMASVNGTLSLGVYISKAAIDGDSISFGGAMIALGAGLFSFADPTGYKVFDALWGPMMGAELGWTYDLLSDLYRKSNTSTRILTYY